MIASDTEGEPCRRVIFCAKHRTQDILLSENIVRAAPLVTRKGDRVVVFVAASSLCLLFLLLLLCDGGIIKQTIPTKLYREYGHLSCHAPTSCDHQEAQQQQYHQQHPPTRWLTVAARCTLSKSNHTAVTRRRICIVHIYDTTTKMPPSTKMETGMAQAIRRRDAANTKLKCCR